jgi:hypothetical protein
VAVALVTTFPADYPSIAPEIDVEIEKGLGRKHVEELKVVIAQCAEDNLGMPSVFAIAEQVSPEAPPLSGIFTSDDFEEIHSCTFEQISG